MPLRMPPAALFHLTRPGSYVHLGILTISYANLAVIVVMLALFALAILLPFPSEPLQPPAPETHEERRPEPEEVSRQWTTRARHLWLRVLPPDHMLPDGQPSYVASWAYTFGIASLTALVVVIFSGFAIALGGPGWWHTTAVGHFFNSLHLWSVELFFAFMVIHLWVKFWMGAWRGRRQLTWMTGALAFFIAIPTAFTGYLAQQNFDSQWISTQSKDAFNAIGVGGLFQVMNFGQMLMWHIVLLPLAVVGIIGAHVLLVRIRGVVPPYPERRSTLPDSSHAQSAGAQSANTHASEVAAAEAQTAPTGAHRGTARATPAPDPRAAPTTDLHTPRETAQ